jgi:hypothetical protein
MDDYKAMLVRAKAQRTNLDQLIAVLEKLVSGEGNGDSLLPLPGTIGGVPEFPPGTFHNLNLAEASKKFLKLVGPPARSTDAIADGLMKGGFSATFSKASLGTVLLRAAKGRSIAKVGRGFWGLPEWYPKES